MKSQSTETPHEVFSAVDPMSICLLISCRRFLEEGKGRSNSKNKYMGEQNKSGDNAGLQRLNKIF